MIRDSCVYSYIIGVTKGQLCLPFPPSHALLHVLLVQVSKILAPVAGGILVYNSLLLLISALLIRY